jgi:iron complex transport system substrate-binding protein
VISLAPEIIIITRMARGGEFEVEKKAWLKWPEIPAVKNNRILLVDSDILDRATPRLVEGFELLARLIHPELFPDAGKEKRE